MQSKNFVIFALDGTLVNHSEGLEAGLVEFADLRSLGPDGLAFLQHINVAGLSVQETWEEICTHFNFPEAPSDLASTFADMLPELTRPYPGVAAGIRKLREDGWKVGVLSNGPESRQRRKLQDGMADLFDALLFCDGPGPRKPDLAAFRRVAELACADLEGGWMVGDSLTEDIAGGAAAGMHTIWISPDAVPDGGGTSPDFVAANASEMFAILQREGRSQ
jgi:HAD superfamily hydrolase (TIGR01662 family)